MRYMLLNSEPTECVRLGMWYMNLNRLDVYVDGVIKLPTNGYIDGNGRYRIKMGSDEEFMPNVAEKKSGQNYLRYKSCFCE